MEIVQVTLLRKTLTSSS